MSPPTKLASMDSNSAGEKTRRANVGDEGYRFLWPTRGHRRTIRVPSLDREPPKAAESIGKETRLVISFQYKECTVEFVLSGKEGPAATTEATGALEGAANQSLLLVDALLPAMPMRLTYGYDTAAKRWFPIHATTRRKGIITDQPYLIAVESLQGGFSVGGRRIPLIEDGTDDVGKKTE